MPHIIPTFCSICERTCGMLVTVENNRIIGITGNPDHVKSRGDLCVKGRAALDIVSAPDRLRKPMRKTKAGWRPIAWDEAFALIADTLQQIRSSFGPAGLAVYHGQTYLKNCLAMALMKRLLRIYGTPNLCSAASECFIPQLLAGITTFGGLPMADIENSRCVLLWGNNPFASGSMAGCSMPRTIRLFNELQQRGARIIVIDPRTSDVAARADLHLRVRPGTDGMLALAMMRVLCDEHLYDASFIERSTSGFDHLKEVLQCIDLHHAEAITRVPVDQIKLAARMFSTTKPASIITGVGVEHHTNTVQTLRAIMSLLAMTGNVDIVGGNRFIAPVMLSFPDHAELPVPSDSPIGMDEHPMFIGMINQAHALVVIEKILTTPESPIKALLVAGGAPIPQLANTKQVKAALQKIPFKAVIDLFMTPTAQEADLVLPAASFLERDEIGTMPLNRQRKVLNPEGLLSDWEIWLQLSHRMGYGSYFPWEDFQSAADALLQSASLSCEELDRHPGGILHEIPPGQFLEHGFPTYSGKIEFFSHALESSGYDPLPAFIPPMESLESTPDTAKTYPLILTTGARLQMFVHSQHRTIQSLRKLHPEPSAEIHPQTAHTYRLQDGEFAEVSSLRGSLRIRVKITEAIMPGVVHLPHGWSEADCNLLTDHEKRDPVSGFPGLRSSLCRIDKIA